MLKIIRKFNIRRFPFIFPMLLSFIELGLTAHRVSAQTSVPNPAVGSIVGGFQFGNTPINLGNAALAAGDYSTAELQFRKAVAESPDNLWPKYGLADAFAGEGKISNAIATYDIIRSCFGQSPNVPRLALFKEAILYDQIGKWKDAVNLYNRAADGFSSAPFLGSSVKEPSYLPAFDKSNQKPEDLEVAANLALGRLARAANTGLPGSWSKEMKYYQQALEIKPDSSVVKYYYAMGLYETGHPDEGKSAMTALLQGSNADIAQYASVKLQKWQSDEALRAQQTQVVGH